MRSWDGEDPDRRSSAALPPAPDIRDGARIVRPRQGGEASAGHPDTSPAPGWPCSLDPEVRPPCGWSTPAAERPGGSPESRAGPSRVGSPSAEGVHPGGTPPSPGRRSPCRRGGVVVEEGPEHLPRALQGDQVFTALPVSRPEVIVTPLFELAGGPHRTRPDPPAQFDRLFAPLCQSRTVEGRGSSREDEASCTPAPGPRDLGETNRNSGRLPVGSAPPGPACAGSVAKSCHGGGPWRTEYRGSGQRVCCAGLRGLSKTATIELAADHTRVNVIAPGSARRRRNRPPRQGSTRPWLQHRVRGRPRSLSIRGAVALGLAFPWRLSATADDEPPRRA